VLVVVPAWLNGFAWERGMHLPKPAGAGTWAARRTTPMANLLVESTFAIGVAQVTLVAPANHEERFTGAADYEAARLQEILQGR
jgi:hypothetical protein